MEGWRELYLRLPSEGAASKSGKPLPVALCGFAAERRDLQAGHRRFVFERLVHSYKPGGIELGDMAG
jgi:hypothetical protein